jgi:hypothetical protein
VAGFICRSPRAAQNSWLFRYKLHGRARWHGLGSLREVNLEEAREKATDALVLRIIEPIWASKTETASRIRSRIEQVIDAAKAKGELSLRAKTQHAGRGISITCSLPRRRFARSAIIRRCPIGNCTTSCASSASVMVPLRQLLSFKS